MNRKSAWSRARSRAWHGRATVGEIRRRRRRRMLRLAGLSLLLLASLPLVTRAAVPDPAVSGPWVRLRTPHLEILSNAGAKDLTRIAGRLERLHDVLELTAPSLSESGRAPACVLLFRDAASLRPYAPRWEGRPVEVAGYFQPGRHADYLAIVAANDAGTERTALHEYVHLVVRHALPEIPLWLNEGLAEYYSTFVAKGSEAEAGAPLPAHYAWLQQGHRIPIGELLLVGHNSPLYNEGERRGTFYAESWALVHALLGDTPGERARFEVMLARLRAGAEPWAALRAAWPGLDDEALRLRMERYLQRNSLPAITWTFSTPFDRIAATPEPVASAEMLFRLGDLLLQGGSDRRDEAEAHFRAALEADSACAAAAASLGALALERGRSADADAWLERAEFTPGADATTYVICAQTRRAEAGVPTRPGARPDSLARFRIARARQDARAALQEDPSQPHALEVLAEAAVLTSGANLAEALDAVRRARQALPARTDLLATEAALCTLRGDEAGTAELAAALDARGERRMARTVRDDVARVRLGRAADLESAGRIAAADSLYRSLPGLEGLSTEMRQEAAARVYNQGAARANRDELPQALPLLEVAAALTPDSSFGAEVSRRLVQTRFRSGMADAYALARAGRTAEARRAFEKLLDSAPGNDERELVRQALARLRTGRRSGS